MFDIDRFIADCRQAVVTEAGGQRAAREVTARAVRDHGAVLAGLGAPARAGLHVLHRSPELTVLNIVWGPRMTLLPHNHNMWAVIGIYTGAEDNIFWRKLPAEAGSRVEAAGAKSLRVGECATLGADIIHSVTNPIDRMTAALHVYGGDFFDDGRSEWDAETLAERPYDVERARRLFEESNRAVG
jgi:predicted metal-dependent enzyme (double-stranded beta helix superfamily)